MNPSSFLHFIYAVGATLVLQTRLLLLALDSAYNSAGLRFSSTGHAITNYSTLLTNWAIELRFNLTISILTTWVRVFDASFVVRHPTLDRLPHFIAHADNQDLRVFQVTAQDYEGVFWNDLQTIRSPRSRWWRTPAWVDRQFRLRDPLNRPPPPFIYDFAHRQLAGPRLVQGLGLIGHGICVLLAEEYGRWPDTPHLLGVKLIDLTSKPPTFVHGRIPVKFVTAKGVRETAEAADGQIMVDWTDLEGIEDGPQVTEFQGDFAPIVFVKERSLSFSIPDSHSIPDSTVSAV